MLLSRISIRVSLIVTIVALAALGLTVAVIGGRIYGDHALDDARLQGVERLRQAATVAWGAQPSADFSAVERVLGLPLRVTSAEGAILYQSPEWPSAQARARSVSVTEQVQSPGGETVRLETARAAGQLYERIRQTQYAVFFAGTAVMLLFMLVALTLLDRVAVAPWRSLLAQVRALERDENELGRRIDADGNAEARALAASFSRLGSRLKDFYEDLERVAFTDALTQLPNRSLLYQRLERASAQARSDNHAFALFVLDLDRFKEINGNFGHTTGDELLKQVAGRIRAKLRESDSVARIGGDEFAVLLAAETAKQADLAARMLLQTLRAPFMVGGHPLEIRASIGIARYPDHGVDAESLLRNAEIAMYAAKQAGGGQMFYEPRMHRDQDAQLALKGELRRAIAEEPEQFVLHFQPKISLKTDRVMSLEALVRWHHPAGRLLLAETFVPLLEQTGFLRHLTTWVVAEAVRVAHELEQAGFDLPIGINAWGRDLHDSGLADELADQLTIHPDLTHWIEVELAEPAVMADAGAGQVLARLAALGFRLVIDHFGTGYSSLAQLQKLPVQAIKIDRSFVAQMVKDESDAAIVSSSIELAHHLGLEAIADGVDDEAVLNRLRARGCNAAQGLYLSRPLPADELMQWLRKSAWSPASRLAYGA